MNYSYFLIPDKNTASPLKPFKRTGLSHWYFFLSGAFIVLILLPLFQKGTFIDGMLYKTVAFNYAEGLSTFWNMKFTDSCMIFFCEQPPLYFFVLGNFYKLFGSNYPVDRFFTFLLFIALVLVLRLIHQQLFKRKGPSAFLSVFLLLTIPVFCWSYVNQVIEPLVCVLTASGIYFFLRFLNENKIGFAFLFAANLFLLFLSKGFQSCFIIGLPFIYFALSRSKKPALYFSIVAGSLTAATLWVLLLLYEPAVRWFNCYYNARLVLTMQNTGKTTDDHLEIIGRFFSELLPCFIILFFLFAYLRVKRKYPLKFILQNFIANKLAVALLLTSFLGSFPFAFSLVQRGFYLLPAFVCFVLAMVYGFKRYWLFFYAFLFNLVRYKITRISCMVVGLGAVMYFGYAVNGFKRDEALLHDLELMKPILKNNERVLVEGDLWNYFSLHSYLYMAKQVSLTQDTAGCRWIIRNKTESYTPEAVMLRLNLPTRELDLVRKK